MNDYETVFEPSQDGSFQESQVPSQSMPPVEQPPKKKKSHKKGGAGFVATALCFSLLGSILGAGGVIAANNYRNRTEETDDRQLTVMVEGLRETSAIDVVNIDTSKELTPAQVYAANVNSTVGITTSITTNYWGFQTTSAASGSGFIISTDGYILTNYHVIEIPTA